MRRFQTKIIVILSVSGIFILGFLLPQSVIMPVEGASDKDYNHETFWYYPWGKSVTHKGVDIFANEGKSVLSATNGLVAYAGTYGAGGNIILVLGTKWRFHYYAHLQLINVKAFKFVKQNTKIGTIGTSGNAKGKPAHLHYSIITPFPYFWRIDKAKQAWLKMFYLNPIDYLPK